MRNDVLIMAVLHEEPARNTAKLSESKLLIQMQGDIIRCYYSIKLKNSETKTLSYSH